jgi:hypothetical protein
MPIRAARLAVHPTDQREMARPLALRTLQPEDRSVTMSLRTYLGGPINGCTDDEANGWREGFKTRPELAHVDFVDPMERDYRGREDDCVNEIVELDKRDIDSVDILLAYAWQPSPGTHMEIMYGYCQAPNSPLVLLVMPEHMRISPWLRYHSHKIVHTLDEAADLIATRTSGASWT